VWNTAVVPFMRPYAVDENAPYVVFNSKCLRLPGRTAIHTQADPFLFVREDELFIFLEVQELGQHGRIDAYVTTDLARFEALGPIFNPGFHVSYPHVFEHQGEIFMVPETWAAREVALYRFADFPFRPVRAIALLEGEYSDATLVRWAERWWIFATTATGLEIHHSAELFGPYRSHPHNPVSRSPESWRCGGPFLQQNGNLFRVAQDGSRAYGANLNIMRVMALTEEAYDEQVVQNGLFRCHEDWNSRGGHHLSTAKFRGREIAAVDGKQTDFLINHFLSLLGRIGI